MSANIFPDNLLDFQTMFYTEKQCREHLFKIKYPDGFVCPNCNNNEYWLTDRSLLHCKNCNHQTSLKSGTIMHGSKKSLKLWYLAFFFVSFQKSGINAKNLQTFIGLGSYQTAWAWLHKIRHSLRKKGRTKLNSCVEVDESFFGGVTAGKRGRGAENKQLLVVGVEKAGKKIGRIRIEVIKDASADSLNAFIDTNIEKNTMIKTDGWRSYSQLTKNGYRHKVIKQKTEESILSSVHLVISQFKRWTLGLHQGLVKGKHLQYYLDEYIFRFNRRKSKSRGKVFIRTIEQAISFNAIPYWKIIGRLNPNDPLKKLKSAA